MSPDQSATPATPVATDGTDGTAVSDRIPPVATGGRRPETTVPSVATARGGATSGTRNSEDDIQATVGPQLVRLAARLDELRALAGEPSLCAGWTIKHVLAHMTMPARYDGPAYLAELEAAGYDFNRLSETVARRDAELPYERLLDDLRSDVLAEWAPPGGGATGALTHAVIHALDITGALGLDRTSDDEACRTVLDALTASTPTPFGVDVTGRLLRATDLAWQRGAGGLIEASAADLILALAGRPRPGIPLARG